MLFEGEGEVPEGLWLIFFFGGVSTASFWQYADSGANPGDQDSWNGDLASLQRYVYLGGL